MSLGNFGTCYTGELLYGVGKCTADTLVVASLGLEIFDAQILLQFRHWLRVNRGSQELTCSKYLKRYQYFRYDTKMNIIFRA